jgi:uncharacterized protein YjbJ (UPF0337 family)
MNKDQIQGKATQVAGKVKRSAGEVTGNERLANQGVADQTKGALQETWGNVKDAAHEAAHTREEERQHKNTEMRDNMATRVEDAKNQATEKIDEFRDRQRQRRSA